MNNNNRNNTNNVRAVSEFQWKMKDQPENKMAISYDSLLTAYMERRKNKSWTETAIAFEMHYERELLGLRDMINRRVYKPDSSITFLVHWPTLREVFAAMFRDRIVQTWIAQRIEPLFEVQFIYSSFNCRKGKGTLAAVKYLQDAIKAKSENYTRDCWVLKYDLKGFFMSINRSMVTEKLCHFVRSRYTGDDLETLIYLIEVTLMNSPAEGCIVKGNRDEWRYLPSNKSLFTVPEGYGLPIGNITSQLVANFLLDETDHYIMNELGLTVDRYVDDTATVDTDKNKLLMAMPLIREHLWKTAEVRVNPKKYYLQHYTKGVKFLGMVVKGDRLYISNRTLGKAMCRLHGFNKAAESGGARYCRENGEHFVACINSYLGFMRQGREYGLRRKFCGLISPVWLKYVVISWDFTKITLKKKYKHRERIKRMLQRKRKNALRNKIIKAKRMTARVFCGQNNMPATVEQFNTGRKRGCAVRWDFESVKTTNQPVDKRANFRKRKALSKGTTEETPVTQEETQGELVDSGLVAYSEMRYMEIPTPEQVVSDIENDLALRYGDGEKPEIDYEAYRTAIAALNN